MQKPFIVAITLRGLAISLANKNHLWCGCQYEYMSMVIYLGAAVLLRSSYKHSFICVSLIFCVETFLLHFIAKPLLYIYILVHEFITVGVVTAFLLQRSRLKNPRICLHQLDPYSDMLLDQEWGPRNSFTKENTLNDKILYSRGTSIDNCMTFVIIWYRPRALQLQLRQRLALWMDECEHWPWTIQLDSMERKDAILGYWSQFRLFRCDFSSISWQ